MESLGCYRGNYDSAADLATMGGGGRHFVPFFSPVTTLAMTQRSLSPAPGSPYQLHPQHPHHHHQQQHQQQPLQQHQQRRHMLQHQQYSLPMDRREPHRQYVSSELHRWYVKKRGVDFPAFSDGAERMFATSSNDQLYVERVACCSSSCSSSSSPAPPGAAAPPRLPLPAAAAAPHHVGPAVRLSRPLRRHLRHRAAARTNIGRLGRTRAVPRLCRNLAAHPQARPRARLLHGALPPLPAGPPPRDVHAPALHPQYAATLLHGAGAAPTAEEQRRDHPRRRRRPPPSPRRRRRRRRRQGPAVDGRQRPETRHPRLTSLHPVLG
ncbi:uncharacterized protein LOC144947190 [Lampetra fluviatilis]